MHTQKLPPSENDVAVLLTFFTRLESLKRTFNAVRKARPARLFLYQDGPRNDVEAAKIEAARRIVADDQIDWECGVKRNYHTTNQGMGTSAYDSLRWAFGLHDKCIVLGEDSMPAVSFISFCTEMLHRYEHDLRIWMIAGLNPEGQTSSPYDYLFTSVFSVVGGWASWRRVFNQWDDHYSVLEDTFNRHQMESYVDKRHKECKEMLKKMMKHRQAILPIYETVFWSAFTLNSGLAIMPTRNMTQNTTETDVSMPAHELTFPLRHPCLVIEDVEYRKRVFRIVEWEHPLKKVVRWAKRLAGRCARG